jgi:hypothetical protein
VSPRNVVVARRVCASSAGGVVSAGGCVLVAVWFGVGVCAGAWAKAGAERTAIRPAVVARDLMKTDLIY